MSLADRLSRAERPDRVEEIRGRLQRGLVDRLGARMSDPRAAEEDFDRAVRRQLEELLDEEEVPLGAAERDEVISQVSDSVLGLGPLEPYMADPTVTEVMVNGPDTIFVERSGKLHRTATRFTDESQLRRTIDMIVGRIGRRIDEASPYVDARLPDGSRVNAIIPPLAVDGPALTIRKFSADPYDAEALIAFGTFSREAAEFLEACVRGRINVLVSGGTGAGKTTTLNVLSSFIPSDERIITVEDAAELRLQQPHVVRLESRPSNIEGRGEITIRDLIRNALRMRPDRIVVGEVRGGEALDMLQAMNTGHDGSISTVHANAPRDVLSRLETMVLMAGMDLPVRAIREQISSAIDVVIQQARLRDGTRRITHVTEVVGMEGDVITLQDVFLFDFRAGTDDRGRFRGGMVPTGLRPRFLEKMRDSGVEVQARLFMTEGLEDPW